MGTIILRQIIHGSYIAMIANLAKRPGKGYPQWK